MAKVLLAKHNDMVKAIPPIDFDKPLRTSVLPRRSWCDRPIPYAHRSKTAGKDIARTRSLLAFCSVRIALRSSLISARVSTDFGHNLRRLTPTSFYHPCSAEVIRQERTCRRFTASTISGKRGVQSLPTTLRKRRSGRTWRITTFVRWRPCRPHLPVARRAGWSAADVEARLRAARGPHADARL